MVTEPLDVQGLLKDSIDGDSEWNELPPKISIGRVHLHVSNLAKAKKILSCDFGSKSYCYFTWCIFICCK